MSICGWENWITERLSDKSEVAQVISDRAGIGNPGPILPHDNYWLNSSYLVEIGHVPFSSPQYLPGPLHSLILPDWPLQAFELEICDMLHHPLTSLAILWSFNWVGNKNGCLIWACPENRVLFVLDPMLGWIYQHRIPVPNLAEWIVSQM